MKDTTPILGAKVAKEVPAKGFPLVYFVPYALRYEGGV
jgi:hypothetical protein